MTDRARCLEPTDPFRQRFRDANRTLTIAGTRLPLPRLG
jgi:hypothetical protein